MAKLGDFPWWPNVWVTEMGDPLSPTQISQKGKLRNARRAGRELTLVVVHEGDIFTAKIGSPLSADSLILLRHVLLQHVGERMSAIESIEIDFADLS